MTKENEMAKWVAWGLGALIALAAAWSLGLADLVRTSLALGHGADWIMGGLCLLWLLVILKAPWDLYFQASAVAFEQERSLEARIALPAGRQAYVRKLRVWLMCLAVGAHLASAGLITGIAYLQHQQIGYWFAVFYLVSTGFRPLLAGYAYLARKLAALGQESHYPREDIAELRGRVAQLHEEAKETARHLEDLYAALAQGSKERDAADAATQQQIETARREWRDRSETMEQELRDRQTALAREFEATTNRLTDNQDVIRGVQAFVRLISQSANPV